MDVRVYADPERLADETARHLARELSISEGPSLGLSGGSTPNATYAAMRRRALDWSAVDFWIGDERWVPIDDPANNSKMCRETFGFGAGSRFHGVPCQLDDDPNVVAEIYEKTLDSIFEANDGTPDLALLGLGGDGHTASLFPESAALLETERRYVANWVEELGVWRLTATIPLLASARQLVFLVAGSGKADAVRWLVDPRPDDPRVPARLVAESSKDVVVMLDEAAAAHL